MLIDRLRELGGPITNTNERRRRQLSSASLSVNAGSACRQVGPRNVNNEGLGCRQATYCMLQSGLCIRTVRSAGAAARQGGRAGIQSASPDLHQARCTALHAPHCRPPPSRTTGALHHNLLAFRPSIASAGEPDDINMLTTIWPAPLTIQPAQPAQPSEPGLPCPACFVCHTHTRLARPVCRHNHHQRRPASSFFLFLHVINSRYEAVSSQRPSAHSRQILLGQEASRPERWMSPSATDVP